MGRTQCCDKNGLKKGPWTPEEDQKLIEYIQNHGHGSWRTLPKNAGLRRCGKSCRLRWTNYLRPDIKRGRFSFEEEDAIIQLHSVLGNKWSAIAASLPGRTDNEIKNYWNTHIRKKLLRMGIDPVTHSPRLDLLDLSSILTSALCNSPQLNGSNFLDAQPLSNIDILSMSSLFPQVENQFHFLQPNNLQSENEGIQTSNSIGPMQAILEQFYQTTSTLSCESSGQNLWHEKGGESSNMRGYYGYDQSISNPIWESKMIQSNEDETVENCCFSTVLASPTTTSARLNSSSTVHVNGGNEDDRDSYA